MKFDREEGPGKVFTATVDQSQIGFISQLSVNLGLIGGGPGPEELIAGDAQAGFFGEVESNEFITGEQLCNELGITQGRLQYSDTEWLKFASKGETIFVAKKPIRNDISWDHIYEQGAVYGDGLIAGESGAEHHNPPGTAIRQDATVEIDGNTYKVRLLRGAADDPTDSHDDPDRGSIGTLDGNYNSSESENEWNNLFLPIHENATDDSWAHPEYVPDNVPDWNVGYSDADLITHRDRGYGSYAWCQETRDTDESRRVYRGYYGVSALLTGASSSTSSNRGFRPALVLI